MALVAQPNNPKAGWFEVFDDSRPKRRLRGDMMPAQCGILVVNDFNDMPAEEIKPLLAGAEEVAARFGYPMMVASTIKLQKGAEVALQEAGWKVDYTFDNARTHRVVTMWRKPVLNVSKGIHWGN